MRTLIRSRFWLLLALVLTACQEDDTGITFDDFKTRAAEFAGEGAQNCGEAAIDEVAEQNLCVAVNFANQMASYAIYNLQGIDSQTARAYSVTPEGRVFRLFYDSDPTGGNSDNNGHITVFECLQPRLSGVTDSTLVSVFICESVAS